jgi:hypothetical protein
MQQLLLHFSFLCLPLAIRYSNALETLSTKKKKKRKKRRKGKEQRKGAKNPF